MLLKTFLACAFLASCLGQDQTRTCMNAAGTSCSLFQQCCVQQCQSNLQVQVYFLSCTPANCTCLGNNIPALSPVGNYQVRTLGADQNGICRARAGTSCAIFRACCVQVCGNTQQMTCTNMNGVLYTMCTCYYNSNPVLSNLQSLPNNEFQCLQTAVQQCFPGGVNLRTATSACVLQSSCEGFKRCCESSCGGENAMYTCEGSGVQFAQCQCISAIQVAQRRPFNDCFRRANQLCKGNMSPGSFSTATVLIFGSLAFLFAFL